MQAKQIFKTISDKIVNTICPGHPTFHQQDDSQGMNVYQSLKENLSNITFLGSNEISVTSAIIISKSFEFKHVRTFMEEQFSQLGEYKYAYVSQRKQNMGKFKYALVQNTLNIVSYGGIFPKYNNMFRIDTIKVVSLMHHIQENL